MAPEWLGWQLWLIHIIQSIHTPLLDKLMIGLSSIGLERVYMIVLPILLWSLNRRFGVRLLYLFLSSMYVDSWLKDALMATRPIGQPGVRSLYLSSAKDYAMPSGHAQASVTFYGFIAAVARRTWVWIVVLILILLVGLSRVYLGLHWPLDVVVGWLLGAVAVIVGLWVCKRWQAVQGFAIRILIAILVPALLLFLQNGSASLQYAAYLLGIGVGAVVLDAVADCDIAGRWFTRVCAVVIGLAGMIALQWIITWSPSEAGMVGRCAVVGLWGTFGAPLVFLWLGLYRRRGAKNTA